MTVCISWNSEYGCLYSLFFKIYRESRKKPKKKPTWKVICIFQEFDRNFTKKVFLSSFCGKFSDSESFSIYLFYGVPLLRIHPGTLLKDELKCFPFFSADLVVSYFVEHFPVAASET